MRNNQRKQAQTINIYKSTQDRYKKHDNCFFLLKNCIHVFFLELFDTCTKKCMNLHLTTQTMIVCIPLTMMLGIMLTFFHWQEYQTKFVAEYINIYESKMLNPVIEGKHNIQIVFENVKNSEIIESNYQILLFHKIYTKELMTKDFFFGSSLDDVHNSWNLFNDVFDNTTETNRVREKYNYYIKPDDLSNNLDWNYSSIFKASYIDPSNNERTTYNIYLRDVFKIFYLFSPLFMQSEQFKENSLLKSYFIAYPLDEYGYVNYFQYPVQKDFLDYEEVNFKPFNTFSDPVPFYLLNSTLTKENWFSKIEANFLNGVKNSSSQTRSNLDIIYDYEIDNNIDIGRYYLPLIQYTLDIKGYKLVFNILSKYERKLSGDKNKLIQHFSFFNLENKLENILKDDDNKQVFESELISNTRFFPFVIPEIYENYFRQGMKPYNETFLYRGTNIDVLEFKSLNIMDTVYNYNQLFIGDQLIYSVIYFYNSFFLRLRERLKERESAHIDDSYINYSFNNFTDNGAPERSILMRLGMSDKDLIEEICARFNLSNYLSMMDLYTDINCMNENEYRNMNYTSYKPDHSIYGVEPSNCYCIPIYCISIFEDVERQKFIDTYEVDHSFTNNYTFASELTLPSKCLLKLSGLVNTRNQLEEVTESKTSFLFQFIAEENVIPFQYSKTLLNVYILSFCNHFDMVTSFSSEVELIVNYIVAIYSFFMILVVIILTCFIFSKSGNMYRSIAQFEAENKRSFIISKKKNDIKDKEETIEDKMEVGKEGTGRQRRTNVFDLRRNKRDSTSVYENQNSSFENVKYSMENNSFNNVTNNANNILNENQTVSSEDEEEDSKQNQLATIKEFTEGGSENEGVSIDGDKIHTINVADSIFAKEEINKNNDLDNIIIEDQRNDHVNLTIKSEYLDQSALNKKENLEISHTLSQNDSNPNVQKEEMKETSNIPEDIREATVKEIKRRVKHSILKRISFTNDKEFSKTLTDNSNPNLSKHPDKLSQIIEMVRSHSDLFKLDFNLNKYANEKQIIIQKYKYLDENTNKFATIFDPYYQEENENSGLKEFSKVLLYEVVSTEFCNYQGMCLNFRFKFNENTTEDTFTIIKYLYSKNIKGRRKSSCLANHIGNIKKKLKLIEKETIFDFFNEELEKRLLEDQTSISFLTDGTSVSNIKSIVNYYLENIHLEWLKHIYENKFAEQFEI